MNILWEQNKHATTDQPTSFVSKNNKEQTKKQNIKTKQTTTGNAKKTPWKRKGG